jgi:hypothetical protein
MKQRPSDLNEIRQFQEKYPDLDLSWMLVDYIEYLESMKDPFSLADQLYLLVLVMVPVGLFALIVLCTLFGLG